MNIALLSTGFLGGKEATAITLLDYAKELAYLKHGVTIISEKRKESLRFEEFAGIKIYRIGFPSKKFNHFSFYNRIFGHPLGIRKMQKDASFDIIHSFSAAPVMALRSILSRFFNRKANIVHTMKSYSREGMGSRFYFLLNWVDIVTVPTQVFATKLIEKGVRKEKIKVIHSHINTKKFHPKNKTELKGKYGYHDRKIILYYGSLWEKKGAKELMESLPLIIEKNPNVLFIFAPRNMPYAEKYVPNINKFPENTQILTEELKIEDYVAMSDLVVLPYLDLIGTEGNPSCMLEAMACKTTVVTSNLPELREIVEDCVFFSEPGNVNSFAEKVCHALDNPSSKMIEKAYLKAQEFSVEKITPEFLDLYASTNSDRGKQEPWN